jgi:YVTN family beta-propeller protein
MKATLPAALIASLLLFTGCDELVTDNGDDDDNGGNTPGTLELVAEIGVGSNPLGIAVAGDYYAVGNHITIAGQNNSVMVIDPATMTVIDSVIFMGNPEDLAWAPSVSKLFVSDDASRRVRSYSIPDLTDEGVSTMAGEGDPDWYGYPAGLIYDATGGGRLWGVEDFSGLVTCFSAASGAVIDTVRFRPFRGYGSQFSFATGISVAFDAGRSRLYVGNLDDIRLEVIDTLTMTKVDSIVWDSPAILVNFVFSDPVNGHIMVNERSSTMYTGTLVVYDADDLSLVSEVDIPGYPDYGGIAWVTEGSRLVLATGTTLTEFATPAYTKLTETTLPSGPARVAYDPVREYYLVTFKGENLVRIYRVPD